MKISQLFVLLAFVVAACSKSESTQPAIQNAKVTTTTVQVPSGLTTAASADTHAASVVDYLSVANSMSSFTSMLAVPSSGATKTSTPIKAINGRIAATESTTVTYTWSDPNYGSVGYQVTDNGTSYHWEFFYKAVGSSDWYKYIDANAMKDNSTGDLEVLDFTGTDPKAIELKFNWQNTASQYVFQWTDSDSYFLMTINNNTKAGSVNFYNGTGTSAVLSASYTWDNTGHGTWKEFDTDGTTILNQGTW